MYVNDSSKIAVVGRGFLCYHNNHGKNDRKPISLSILSFFFYYQNINEKNAGGYLSIKTREFGGPKMIQRTKLNK